MKALGILFSNIHDKTLLPLTHNRTLASVPFGGRYRLIDFALSNMINSGISKVGIITKEHYQSLLNHVGNGKSWDLARKKGGLTVLPPFAANQTSLYDTRFEAICHVERYVAKSEEPYIVMSDCDNVCNIDFAHMLASHIAHGADLSVVYQRQTLHDNHARTVFTLNNQRRVIKTSTLKKQDGTHNVYTHMLIANRTFLLGIIGQAKTRGFKSFSKDILTRTDEFNIYAHPLNGYYAPIFDLLSYYNVNMALFKRENREQLFYAGAGSIYTKVRDSAPLQISKTASISNSMIADGCCIEGEVLNSILFRGCKVCKGAKVKHSILFQDSVVGIDSIVNCVIADKKSVILEKRLLSGHNTYPQYIAKGTII